MTFAMGADGEAAKAPLEADGFAYRHTAGLNLFLDGADTKPRDAVHIVFAHEKVRAHETLATPDITDSEEGPLFRVLSPEALVRVTLSVFRDKDRMHRRDLTK